MTATILTLPEVADYLRCHPATIFRLVQADGIPYFRVGRTIRFNLASIQRWHDQQIVKSLTIPWTE